MSIERDFNEKLWHSGHSVGNVKGKLLIQNMPFLSQLKIGVLDNKGISFTSNTFIASKSASNSKSKYLTTISKLQE